MTEDFQPTLFSKGQTLRESYLAEEFWVVEVMLLIREGLAGLRKAEGAAQDDDGSRDSAILVAEAVRRLLLKRWEREAARRSSWGWFARLLPQTVRESYHCDLEVMCQGILRHYGWWALHEVAVVGARERAQPFAELVISAVVSPVE